jgi:hypothetical protein
VALSKAARAGTAPVKPILGSSNGRMISRNAAGTNTDDFFADAN